MNSRRQQAWHWIFGNLRVGGHVRRRGDPPYGDGGSSGFAVYAGQQAGVKRGQGWGVYPVTASLKPVSLAEESARTGVLAGVAAVQSLALRAVLTSTCVNTAGDVGPGTTFAHLVQEHSAMVANVSDINEWGGDGGQGVWEPEINVLVSEADWAWPEAVRDIFQPRGINLLVARGASEFVEIIQRKRVHTMIVDMDSEKSNGLATVRIIRMDYPLIPCILLTSVAGESLLGKALRLDVFSVIDKPVDMLLLRRQLHRLFVKKYGSHIFAD